MTRDMLAKTFGVSRKTILCMMKRRGLERTQEQKDAILAASRIKERTVEWKNSRRKIEGGGRNNGKSRWHKEKWIEKNGDFSEKKILVYKNGVENFDELVLISKINLYDYFEKRTRRLEREKNITERKKQEEKDELLKKQKKENSAVKSKSAIFRQKEEKDRQKRFEEIKSLSAKTPDEAFDILAKEDRVPIRVDSKTTVWVKRDKCEFIDGAWFKKTPLNIEKAEKIPTVARRVEEN